VELGCRVGCFGTDHRHVAELDAQGQKRGGRGQAGPAYSLSDPAPQDPALRGAIDLHAHQDPNSNGPSYGQAARSLDAMDLVERARASGMRGFVIKQHLDQTAGLAYYIRKLYPDNAAGPTVQDQSREDSGLPPPSEKQSLES
jgi:hypothetical protein